MLRINNFEGSNEKVVEIVSNISGYELLKRSGNDNLKVFLPLELCIGNLGSIKNFNRDELRKYLKYSSTINDGPFEEGFNFEKELKKIKKLGQIDKIRVWSSRLNCNDYSLLLFVCNFFDDKNISVIYADELPATTITEMNKDKIKELLKKEHILENFEIEQFKQEWKKMLDENTELRFMINGSVKSVDIDYFDADILKRLEKMGEVNIYSLVADLMENPIIPFACYSDYIYLYLIYRLIDKEYIKKIKINDKVFVKLNRKEIIS